MHMFLFAMHAHDLKRCKLLSSQWTPTSIQSCSPAMSNSYNCLLNLTLIASLVYLGENPIKTYLSDMDRWDTKPPSKTRSRQLFDLGFNPLRGSDKKYMDKAISQVQQRFDLVMIMERFDESLILLKVSFGFQDFISVRT